MRLVKFGSYYLSHLPVPINLSRFTSKRFFVFLERDVLFFVFVASRFAIPLEIGDHALCRDSYI